MALALLGAAIFALGLIAWLSIWLIDELQRHDLALQQDAEILVDKDRLESAILGPARDVHFLANMFPLATRTESTGAPDWQAAEQLFVQMARAKPEYDQLRFIDPAGQEQVRVQRYGDRIGVFPRGGLQNKADRYYFSKAMALAPGETYLSPIDLNIERGQVTIPLMPVLRIATQVRDASGAITGVLIANLDVSAILSSVGSPEHSESKRLLLNETGSVLGGTASARYSELILSRPAAFPRQHPEAWTRLTQGQLGHFEHDGQFYGLEMVSPEASSSYAADPLLVSRHWYLVSIRPAPNTAALLLTPRGVGGMLLLLLLLGWSSWRLSCLWHDRNEAKRGKKQAEDATARLESVMNTAEDGLIVLDGEGRIQAFNRACEQIFDYRADDVIGRDVALLSPPSRRGAGGNQGSPQADTVAWLTVGSSREVTGRRKNGDAFPLELAVGAFNDNGKPAFVCSVRDIGARKALEDELEQQRQELLRSNHDLEQFAYIASHDLKSPLRAIGNAASWLREDLDSVLNDEQKHLLQLVDQRITSMQELLEGILAYSRAGRANAACVDVDPDVIIQEFRELNLLPEGFEVLADGDLPHVVTQQAPFRQVLENLISNAVKHHDRDRGTIHVRARDNGDFVRFSIEDDGPGIPQRHRERIFRMFGRLDPGSSRDGSGIGLALVKKLVERKGGHIEVSGTNTDRGAAFHFDWPKQEPGTSGRSARTY